MRVSIIPPQIFLPTGSAKLGRFVTNIEQPHQNFHDPSVASQASLQPSLLSGYTGEYCVASDSGFGLTLTSLLSAGFSNRTKLKIRVATEQIKIYTLPNSDSWFEEATRLPVTCAWLEWTIDHGLDIFMIVSFTTATDVSITQESVARTGVGGQVEVPVSLSLATAGVVAPLGGLIDPTFSGHQKGLRDAQARFLAPGEQVCAVKYRKICHRWLSSKRIDKARLSTVRQWPSMDRARDEEDGEDDLIEVELVDVDGLREGWEKRVVEDNVLFMPCFDKSKH